jgi:hypothetical protein
MNAEQVIDRLIAEELDAHTMPDMKRVLRNERMKLQSATVGCNKDRQKAAHILCIVTRHLRQRVPQGQPGPARAV